MGDPLIHLISESVLSKAAESVLHRFELPLKTLLEAPQCPLIGNHHYSPWLGPVGVVISIRTKDKATILNMAISAVLGRLTNEKIIEGQERIRELHAARLSSFDEQAEIFIYSLDDQTADLN